jgi:endonuclease/exonuclease/phosphatase family metal-dependent hydrolase
VALRVLSWNLFHGRAVPGAGVDLHALFAEALGGWEWDVALLQEVPPWWLAALVPDAATFVVATSRNALPGLRRAAAERWPDLVGANGGGCNAILVRGGTAGEHRTLRLCRLPERRWLHAVRLASGVWVGNVHLSGRDRPAARQARRAGAALLGWAAGAPAVLGGDFNLLAPAVSGLGYAGGCYVDYILAAGMSARGEAVVPDRGRLSDHAPVVVTLDG